MTAPADERETSELEQWRGVAAEHSDEITERASIFLRRRSRALLADLLRPYGSFLWVLVIAVVIENAARLSLPWLVHRGHRLRRATAGEQRRRPSALPDCGFDAACGADPVRQPDVLPSEIRTGRPGGAVGASSSGLSALSAARRPIPRPLYIRPGRVPAHQRHRRHRGAAGRGLRRSDHCGAHHDRRGHLVDHPRCPARSGVPAVLPDLDGADPLVLDCVHPHLPAGAGDLRSGHRLVRGDHDRHPGRPGVSAGTAQRRDLHRPGGALRRREHEVLPADRDLHARRAADRQPDHWRRLAVRRLHGHRGPDDHRRPRRLLALPADVLRTDAGDQPVLQHVPVGVGCVGEALGRARGGTHG